jgi:hypothetical protein
VTDTVIRVHVPAIYAAEIAEVFAKRLGVLNYPHRIEVDESVQVDAAIESERQSAGDYENQLADRRCNDAMAALLGQWP